jgi:hypothetical protein
MSKKTSKKNEEKLRLFLAAQDKQAKKTDKKKPR